jgi:hypothetical protein
MSPTGEHSLAQPVGESSAVRLSLVVVLLGIAAAAGTAHWRLGAAEAALQDLRQEARAADMARQGQELTQQRLELRLDVISKSVSAIEAKLERWDRSSRTIRAGDGR